MDDEKKLEPVEEETTVPEEIPAAESAPEEPAEKPAEEPAAEEAAPAEAPAEPAAEENAPAEAPAESAAAAAPAAKKPLPKWLPLAIIGAAAVVLIILLIALLPRGGGSGDKTTQFLTAMDEGDYAKVVKLAACTDEDFELTEDNVKPMCELYQTSARFRLQVRRQLRTDAMDLAEGDEPEEEGVIHLNKKGRVAITPCTAEVGVDVACTIKLPDGTLMNVTKDMVHDFVQPDPDDAYDDDDDWVTEDEYGDGWDMEEEPQVPEETGEADPRDMEGLFLGDYKAVYLENLLPGRYPLQILVQTSYGDAIDWETDLMVWDEKGSWADAAWDGDRLYISNTLGQDMELYINGQKYRDLKASEEGWIYPIRYETEVEARLSVEDMDEPMTETFSLDTTGDWAEPTFSLTTVELYNASDWFVKVYENDKYLVTLEPNETFVNRNMLPGRVIRAEPLDGSITNSYEIVSEDYDIYDELYFDLNEEALNDISELYKESLTHVVMEEQQELPDTVMLELMGYYYAEALEEMEDPAILSFEVDDLYLNDIEYAAEEETVTVYMDVEAYCNVEYTEDRSSGDVYDNYAELPGNIAVQYADGQWTILP